MVDLRTHVDSKLTKHDTQSDNIESKIKTVEVDVTTVTNHMSKVDSKLVIYDTQLTNIVTKARLRPLASVLSPPALMILKINIGPMSSNKRMP